MALLQVIYMSTAAGVPTDAQLDALLEAAVRNNGQRGITGMLLYCGNRFLQVLEGQAQDVEQAYARIVQDPRHMDVFLLHRGDVAQREFDRWRMGFRRVGEPEAQRHPDYAPMIRGQFDPARMGAQPGVALDMLRAFAREPTDS